MTLMASDAEKVAAYERFLQQFWQYDLTPGMSFDNAFGTWQERAGDVLQVMGAEVVNESTVEPYTDPRGRKGASSPGRGKILPFPRRAPSDV
jgi:hypothetical protein